MFLYLNYDLGSRTGTLFFSRRKFYCFLYFQRTFSDEHYLC